MNVKPLLKKLENKKGLTLIKKLETIHEDDFI